MKQTLTIRRRPKEVREAVRIRKVNLKQRIFKKIFGEDQRVTILIPGDNVTSVEIREEEASHESRQTITGNE